jgi:hypothetical protein
MADEVDVASDYIEKSLQQSILAQRQIAKSNKLPLGICVFCDDDAPLDASFSSVECRDDYQDQLRLKRISGAA